MASKPTGSNEPLLQLVTFQLGGERYALDILGVQEINRVTKITRVPNAPAFVEGVMNLRGNVIPLVDIGGRLGIPKIERAAGAPIIVVDLHGQRAGFIVDSVERVLRIPVSAVDAPPSLEPGSGGAGGFVRGVGHLESGDLLVILDAERLLTHAEQRDLGAMGTGS